MKINLSTFNMRAISRDIEFNFFYIAKLFLREQSKSKKKILAVFPELSLTGYLKDRDWFLEKRVFIEKKTNELARLTAGKSENILVFGAPSFGRKGELRISQFVCASGKIIGRHDKIVLSSSEKETFTPGSIYPQVIDAKGVKIGIMICYETHFPDLAFELARKGAQIILAPFASPMETASQKLARFLRYLPARAYDNSCFLGACNLVWELSKGKFSPGTALILDPKGRVLARSATKGESVCRAEIDFGLIDEIKKNCDAYFIARNPKAGLLAKNYN